MAEVFAERTQVLPSQNFGRGHQNRLVSVSHRQQHGVLRHHRLAAPHFALQQTIHRHVSSHVRRDFFNGLLLVIGQFVGEQTANARIDFGGRRQCRGETRSLQIPTPQCQGQLQDQ